jgi:hypothetical protein
MNQAQQQQGGPQLPYQQRRYQNGPDQDGGDAGGDQPEVTVHPTVHPTGHPAGHPAGQAIEAELEAEQRERDPRD